MLPSTTGNKGGCSLPMHQAGTAGQSKPTDRYQWELTPAKQKIALINVYGHSVRKVKMFPLTLVVSFEMYHFTKLLPFPELKMKISIAMNFLASCLHGQNGKISVKPEEWSHEKQMFQLFRWRIHSSYLSRASLDISLWLKADTSTLGKRAVNVRKPSENEHCNS